MIYKKIHPYLMIAMLTLLVGCNERFSNSESALINNILSETTTQDKGRYVMGKVTRIADGDTFTMIFDNGFEVRVRLLGIDSPERRQAFSNRAKQTLSDLIYNKEVKVYYESKDRYGRVLGDIYIDDLNINQEMVRRGMAWHFIRYSDDETLAALEKEARKNKIGLWVDPNPVAPWEFRRK
jgi:micrococcal nuclease